jgi:hypothetical protein
MAAEAVGLETVAKSGDEAGGTLATMVKAVVAKAATAKAVGNGQKATTTARAFGAKAVKEEPRVAKDKMKKRITTSLRLPT